MEYTQQEKDHFIKMFTRDQIISQVVGSVAILAVTVGIPLGIYLHETSVASKRADSLKTSYIVQSQSTLPASEKVRSTGTEESSSSALPPVPDKKFLEAEVAPDLIQQIQALTAQEVASVELSSNARAAAPFSSPSGKGSVEESTSFFSYTNSSSSSGFGGSAGGGGSGGGGGGGSGGGSPAAPSPLAQVPTPSLSVLDPLASPPLSWQDGILVGEGLLTRDVAIPSNVIFSPGHSPGTLDVNGYTLQLGNVLQIEITDAVNDMILVTHGGVLDVTQLTTIEIIGEPPLDYINSQQSYEFPIIDYTDGTLIGSLADVVLSFSGMPFKSGTLSDSGGVISVNILHNPEMPAGLFPFVLLLLGSALFLLRKKFVK